MAQLEVPQTRWVSVRRDGSNVWHPRVALCGYSGDAGGGSQTFAQSDRWRSLMLGTVAAGALLFGYGRRAYAQVVPPNAPCDTITGGGTTVTCTGNVSTGVLLNNGGGPYTTLNVNTLTANITPGANVDGITFTSNGAVTINTDTGTYNIQATGASADGIYASSTNSTVTINSNGDVSSDGGAIGANTNAGAISVTSVGNLNGNSSGINLTTASGAITVDSTGDVMIRRRQRHQPLLC